MITAPVRRARRPLAGSRRTLALELLEILVLAVGIYLVVTFVFETVHVIGFSMLPTLNDGDFLIASKIEYRLHSPQRGDIVILHNPFGPRDLIKRVIGLPGERLLIRDGKVFVNGRLLQEPYISSGPPSVNADWPGAGAPDGAVLPAGDYFVMGDNRNHSSDSRVFGPVARGDIEARAWFRVWPMTHFGALAGGPSLQTLDLLGTSLPDPLPGAA